MNLQSSWRVAPSLPPPGSVSAEFEGHLLPIDYIWIYNLLYIYALISIANKYVYHFDLHLRISKLHESFARHKSGLWFGPSIYHVRYVNTFLNNDHSVVEESYASICASVKRD